MKTSRNSAGIWHTIEGYFFETVLWCITRPVVAWWLLCDFTTWALNFIGDAIVRCFPDDDGTGPDTPAS